MKKFCKYYDDDPFFKYTNEERDKMTDDEFYTLLEESNACVEKKYRALLNEGQKSYPRFNTIEECMEYYDAIPLDEMINNMNNLFDDNDNNK